MCTCSRTVEQVALASASIIYVSTWEVDLQRQDFHQQQSNHSLPFRHPRHVAAKRGQSKHALLHQMMKLQPTLSAFTYICRAASVFSAVILAIWSTTLWSTTQPAITASRRRPMRVPYMIVHRPERRELPGQLSAKSRKVGSLCHSSSMER